ncbi:MAG: toll/interleukin-1 receptor domain-containing protein [Bacteroidia bacterium]|nr:toll/interleukin-1 receptor domain-containing protein [Bacteroidia bacterium]
MKFNPDIFISYTHRDNVELSADAKGWVSDFHEVLESFLNQMMDRKPHVWRDVRTLAGNTELTPEILESISKTGILVTIMSPAYLNSQWTTLEREKFLEVAQKEKTVTVNNRHRIFKVLKSPVPLDKHPEQVKDLLGYAFYKLDDETGRAREFNRAFGKELEQSFLMKAYDVATDIAETLSMLDEVSSANQNGSAEGVEDQGVIYLALGGSDVTEERDIVRRELEGLGWKVLPDKQFPFTAPEFEQYTRENLDQCKMAIHLIGGKYGLVPDGAKESISEVQNRLAAAKSKAENFPRLIWINPKLKPEDERQERFTASLRRDPEVLAGADIIEKPMDDLKSIIIEKFSPKKEEAPKETDKVGEGGEGLRIIYLIFDKDDRRNVRAVRQYLFDKGIEVTTPSFDGTEAEVREAHHERLVQADAVAVFFGEVNTLWVESQLSEIRKAPGYGRDKPFSAKPLVILAGADTDEKLDFMTHQADVIEAFDGVPEKDLDKFANQILSAGAPV